MSGKGRGRGKSRGKNRSRTTNLPTITERIESQPYGEGNDSIEQNRSPFL